MSHANARTTPAGRLLIVQRHLAGWPQAHIAAAMGISRKCVRTWLDRYAEHGQAGLVDRSSRPHHSPTRTSARVEQLVLELRRTERRGPEWISAELADRGVSVPPRTISRILARHQVPHLAICDPITGQVIRASRHTTIRYERPRPGELVHMDVKKLGKIPPGGGWRAQAHQGQTPTNHRSRADKTPIGYDYVHTLIDDHTRLAYCEVLSDEKGTTCAGFLTRAAAYFTAHGITRIEELMTDNAWAYRWSLRHVVAQLGARHLFIQIGCPWQNGKAERLNRTLLTEWAYRRTYTSNDQRTAALATWLEHYNTVRRHSALGGQPPISRLPT